MATPTTYNVISNSEIDADSPITTSLMTRLRDNPVAIAEGAAHPDAGSNIFTPRIAIDKDPNFDPDDPDPSHADKQIAVVTDQTNSSLVLVPDGSGSVEWVSLTTVSIASLFQVEGTWSASIGSTGATKIVLPTEKYDINNDYASGEFTAPVAGKYEFNFHGGVYATTGFAADTGWFYLVIERDQGSGSWTQIDQITDPVDGNGTGSGNGAVRSAWAHHNTIQQLAEGEKVRLIIYVTNDDADVTAYIGGAQRFAVDYEDTSFQYYGSSPHDKAIFSGKFVSA